FFFFSSRRRHTRWPRDWSSDVCSSDLLQALEQALDSRFEDVGFHLKYAEALFARGRVKEAAVECRVLLHQDAYNFNGNLLLANEIGRASCRERVEISGVGGAWQRWRGG